MIGLLLLGVSAGLLTVGAELFAEHAASAGRRLGVTALAVGLVIAGAEPEEMVTGVIASARHHPGIAAGDAVGANVTMLTVVLGLVALLAGLPVAGRVRGYALAAGATGLLSAALITAGYLGRPGGGLLVAAYLGLLVIIWRVERRPPAIGEVAEALGDRRDASSSNQEVVAARPAALEVTLVLVGVGIMTLGGWAAVAGSERVVTSLGLAEHAVGLSLVALATTAELFALAWASMRRGITELAVAGVVGSAAYNATATLGVAALVHPLTTGGVVGAAWLAAGLPIAIIILGGPGHRVGRLGGLVLLAVYAAYLALVLA